ncbi:MAG: hypothetical protein K0R05_2414 [Anaerocolumna sp.]|jgi:uncharacterized membrane protein (UPF0136 family)|nr:hypothetical protein [Anaerocolumna sp.]
MSMKRIVVEILRLFLFFILVYIFVEDKNFLKSIELVFVMALVLLISNVIKIYRSKKNINE